MNILISSVGRRVKVIKYFKDQLSKSNGKLIAADCDKLAPALYFADKYALLPKITDKDYLPEILQLCKEQEIDVVISLIDPELEMLAKNERIFKENNIQLCLSPYEVINTFFDKLKTHIYLSKRNIPSVPTYNDINVVISLLNEGEISLPLVIKPALGSASIGINIVHSQEELMELFNKEDNLIIQPFYKDKEFGVDVYVDLISGNLIDMFIKEKVRMRSGETDKSISIHSEEIMNLVVDLISKTNFRGPIDIDIFEYKGKYYISEVNPRFGGGYPHAHTMGCNFPFYIINNIKGKENSMFKGFNYKSDFAMMKYDDVLLRKI